MNRESMTRPQASCILIMFIFGSTLIFGVGTETGQDIWISLILTLAMIIPVSLIYARLIKLFPAKGLFEMLQELFGKIAGKILICVFVWYAMHLTASVLRNFTDFIQITAMPEPPQFPLAILLMSVIIYLAKCGLETFGKWAIVTFIIICAIIPLTLLFSISAINFRNLLPVLDNDWPSVLKASYQQFSLPFGETVLFLGVADSLKRGESPYKAYLYGILCAGIISILILIRNVTVLGPTMMESVYFPSFVTGKIINLSDSFARVESIIAMNYLFAGLTKMSLCVFVAAKGVASLFNIPDYKKNVIPVCFACLALSIISYDSVTHLFDFVTNYYPIYVTPFQTLIPLLMWITGEIKRARGHLDLS